MPRLSAFFKFFQVQFHGESGIFPVGRHTKVFEDNTASITLAYNPGVPHKRSKHFGEWAIFKESVSLGEVALEHVSTETQLADMLTKALVSDKFREFRDAVMGTQVSQEHFASGYSANLVAF